MSIMLRADPAALLRHRSFVLGAAAVLAACSPGPRAAAAGERVTATNAAPVAVVAAGSHHTCAIVDNQLRCWGDNRTGALGDGTTIVREAPVAVVVERAEAGDRLVAGQGFSCVVRRARLRCWGSLRRPPAPTGVRDVAEGVSAAAAYGASLCIVRMSGGVACTSEGPDLVPLRDIPGVANAAAVAVSARAVCALDRGGAVTCLGLPYKGPVLDEPYLVPERVAAVHGLADVAEIAIVESLLVARQKNGSVVGVLLATPGGAPPGATATQKLIPLPGLVDAVALAPFGSERVCGVRAGGSVACIAPLSPSAPSVLHIGARTIAGGPAHACAALTAGGVKCWGENTYGQVAAEPSPRPPSSVP